MVAIHGGAMPSCLYLAGDFSACENWSYHIWRQYDRSCSRDHKKAVSVTKNKKNITLKKPYGTTLM